MNVLDRITELQNERNWTTYKLAQESGIPQSTISSWYSKKQTPAIASLEHICDAFNISMAQFFDNGEPVSLTIEQQKILSAYNRLSKYQQAMLLNFLDAL